MVHIILLFTIILAFSRYGKRTLFAASFMLLTLFSVLRYNYGNDYKSYMISFNSIHYGVRNPFKNEYLFTLLNKVSPNYYFLIAIISILFLVVIYKMINDNLKGIYRGLAIFIFLINPYLFLMNLSALRQCIAMCIFIVSLKFLQDRQLFKYILMIILATMFHTSAIILIPLFFFINDHPMNKFQVYMLISCMILLLVEGSLFAEVVEMGLKILNNSDYIFHFSQGITNSLRATLLTGVYFIYVATNLVHLKGYKLICGKLYLIGLFFGMLAFHFSMLTRIQMYFDIFSIIALPAIMEFYLKNVNNRLSRTIQLYAFPLAILLIYFARYYSFFSNPMWESFNTYQTILEVLL